MVMSLYEFQNLTEHYLNIEMKSFTTFPIVLHLKIFKCSLVYNNYLFMIISLLVCNLQKAFDCQSPVEDCRRAIESS